MNITSAVGLGSGLDINGIVQALVEAEGAPTLNTIQKRENAANVNLSALSQLKSSLNEFNKAFQELNKSSSFNEYKTTSEDETIITALASQDAAKGTYQIEVSQLATNHKLISQSFSDAGQAVGKGTLTLSMGAESFVVTIDDSNNSLTGLKNAINDAVDNPGVRASIIQVDDGLGGQVSKLVITANETGTANQIKITANEDVSAPGLGNFVFDASDIPQSTLEELTAAEDAIILVDGQTATRSSNSIDDVIEGLTLNLNKASPGTNIQVGVSLDEAAIKEKFDDFVSRYNSLMKTMGDLQKVGEDGEKNGALVGDSLLRNLMLQVRSVIGDSVSGVPAEVNSLAMIGLSIDRYGQMSLSEDDFNAVLNNNFLGLQQLFTSSEGISAKLDEKINPYLMTGGLIAEKTQSLEEQLKKLEDDRTALDKRLELVERRLMKQFIAMDAVVGQLQSTSAYLTQQLASLT